MLAYDGGAQHIKGYQARLTQSLERYADAVKTFERMKASGFERRDLQRRRHGDLQHHDEGARIHRRPGRQLRVHGCQYLEIGDEKGDIFTDFAPSLTVMTTIVNTLFYEPPHDGRGNQGAHAEQARPDCAGRARLPVYGRIR